MFAQPFDHSFNDLFNQYVNMDTLSVDGNKDVSFPSEFDQMFPLDSFSSECGDQSPTVSTTQHTHQSAQPWGKDPWCLSHNTDYAADQSDFNFQDSIQLSTVSDLNAGQEFPSASHQQPASTRSSPSTPPATPRRKIKSGLITPKSIKRHREPNDRRGLLRKQSFSPSLMRTSHLQKGSGRMAYPEAWTQGFQNFSIRSSDECLPLSPPPSDILIQHENIPTKSTPAQMNPSAEGFARDSAEMPHQYDSSVFNHSPAITMPSPSAHALAKQQQRYLNQSNNSGLTPSPPSADDLFSSPHSSDPQSMSSWNSDSLGTPAFQFTPDLQGHDAQAWWSPMSSRVAPPQASYQQMIASPVPQRPLQASTNQSDLLQGGLMIQLDPFEMPSATRPPFPASTIPSTTNTQDTRTYSHGTPMPQKYADTPAFTTPNLHNQSRSPSLSPHADVSPKDGTIMRNGMIMKTSQRRTHGRKLSGHSMGAPKPLKGPNGSPKGANKSVTVSFVNFTPNDSHKILTGVAPSGSSKTKARREQEARDRRRKLSEAALNAVRKAGGDVEALEAVFC
ncbi:hypothetical protein P175DRAFT_029071 [Aspergillus ochraceoroseus IBT 24754]|uniref:Developmental regulatory protein wetA n=2 Tax=Aspergillus ochraceoroseus TaxID=138278 RepID=A0A2T5M723_9EURO|nr:uncharacterized protein P175DRAFT_029071 [Aspergillus ochraceoroseus IBT 24754]KKK12127.1 hypothetical protein AOCH_002665 [Aspergillus ochraceoroseus]PTU24335.1 hypothetical protein P175DRAFT_029071 [Aspergillus ochraceoroseus IBT 24754]